MSKSKFKLKEKIYSRRFGYILFVSKTMLISRSVEHSHALYVLFILEARGRSRAESPKRTHMRSNSNVSFSKLEGALTQKVQNGLI